MPQARGFSRRSGIFLSSLEFRQHLGNFCPLLLASYFRVEKQLLGCLSFTIGLCKNSRALSASPLPRAGCEPKNTRRFGA